MFQVAETHRHDSSHSKQASERAKKTKSGSHPEKAIITNPEAVQFGNIFKLSPSFLLVTSIFLISVKLATINRVLHALPMRTTPAPVLTLSLDLELCFGRL